MGTCQILEMASKANQDKQQLDSEKCEILESADSQLSSLQMTNISLCSSDMVMPTTTSNPVVVSPVVSPTQAIILPDSSTDFKQHSKKRKCSPVVQPLSIGFDDNKKEISDSEYISDSVDDDADEDFRLSGSDADDNSNDSYDSETSEVIEVDTEKTAERNKKRLPGDLSSVHQHYRVHHVGEVGTDSREQENRQTTDSSGSQIGKSVDTGSRTEESDKALSKQRIKALFRDIRLETYEEKNGKRNYSKTVYCPVCTNKYQSKISSHLLTVHPNDKRVREIRDMPLGSTRSKMALQKLQNEGNFQHNTQVLAKGEGLFIVCRRTRNGNKAWEYIPCEFCLGFYHEKQIWAHAKGCNHRSAQVDSTANYLRNGRAMLSPFLIREDKHFEYLDEVISKMKETSQNPGLKGICYEDALIREFGIHLLDRLGTEKEQRRKDQDNIRTKMRSVARLLVKLNEPKILKQPLNFFISAQQFMNVVNAVKEVSRQCGSPQLAVNLGGYLKQIGLLKKSLGRREEDERKKKEAKAFLEEFDAHWNSKVSAVANRTKRLNSLNKRQEVPSTDDLVKLKDYLLCQIKEKTKNLIPTYAEYVEIAQVIIARIAMFNMRRIAEVDELKVSDYHDRIGGNEVENNKEICNALYVTEKALLQRIEIIEVRGKSTRGIRKVFILLSKDMVKGIEYILKIRAVAGVKPENQYLFGRTSATALDGCAAMRAVTKACPGLLNPEFIRTRYLRRYLATTTQIMDMSADELKLIADHMGHSVQIHTDIYRLQSSVLERTKVAKALVAIETGNLNQFRGQALNSISIDEIPLTYDEEGDPWTHGEEGDYPEEECSAYGEGEMIRNDTDYDEQVEITARPLKQGIKRKRWSEEEERDFKLAFEEQISQRRNVFAEEIRKAKRTYPSLKDRSEAVIRSKMNNIVLGKLKGKRS